MGRKPKGRVRISWAAQEAILKSQDAIKSMPARERRQLLGQVIAARRRLEGQTCSVVWFEDIWHGGAWYTFRYGGALQSTWHEMPGKYPPPADTTPMQPCECRACRQLKRLWPNGYVKTARLSYECFLESRSAGFLRQLPGAVPVVLRERDARRGWIQPEADGEA